MNVLKMQTMPETDEVFISSLRENILRTLSYFSVFSYPVTPDQVLDFFPDYISSDTLFSALKKAAEQKQIHFYAGYFQLTCDLQAIDRRLRGEELYRARFSKALQSARLIHRFPFVESVSFSGGFSKGKIGRAHV